MHQTRAPFYREYDVCNHNVFCTNKVMVSDIPCKHDRNFIKRRVYDAGYRVSRLRPENRFDAMEQTLRLLHKAGYQPRVIIDAGANEGNWTRMAMRFFPNAHIHLIEPQPAYYRTLKLLVKSAGKLTLHPCALTRPGLLSVHMAGAGTGAWVLGEEESTGGTIECPASTLDDLFGRELSSNDRCLLKLDLEGHEWTALQGGVQMLRRVEVIVAEVQFFGNRSE